MCLDSTDFEDVLESCVREGCVKVSATPETYA